MAEPYDERAPAGEWKAFGACRGLDPGVWYPEAGESSAAAKAICDTCPVEDVCLEMALANRERYGVWGGTSEVERRGILRRRNGYHPEMRRAPRPRKRSA